MGYHYEKYFKETDEDKKTQYLKEFEKDLNNHIKAISEKYIVTGETAQEKIMFIFYLFRAIEDISLDFIKEARKKNVIFVIFKYLFYDQRTYKLLARKTTQNMSKLMLSKKREPSHIYAKRFLCF